MYQAFGNRDPLGERSGAMDPKNGAVAAHLFTS